MTFREKLMQDDTKSVNPDFCGGCYECPEDYRYELKTDCLCEKHGYPPKTNDHYCSECWNREMPGTDSIKEAMKNLADNNITECASIPHILDSGDRTQFETGAVRDMREGKGRCDLLPLDVVSTYICRYNENASFIFAYIADFITSGDWTELSSALDFFVVNQTSWGGYTMLLEVAKHFEEGAKKYGDNNWRKGIPVKCYIDSAIRHYLKYLRGDKDEPHDRAFCWNILCAIWTCRRMPELNDYRKEEKNG